MSKKNHSSVFQVYRYQLLPLSQQHKLIFDDRIQSIEDVKRYKNELFVEALSGISQFSYATAELVHKSDIVGEDFFVIRLAVKRKVTVSPEPFNEQALSNWPSLLVIINNDPLVQKVAIGHDPKVFNNSSTIARILEGNLNPLLNRFNLAIYLEPTFEKNDFWTMVDRHAGRIVQVRFELISPNMANISKALNIDLGSLNRSTNTNKTNLELNSDKESNLALSKDNEQINGLVDYASEGGGRISIKIKGLAKRFHTSEHITEIEIDDLDLSGDSKQIKDIIGTLLK